MKNRWRPVKEAPPIAKTVENLKLMREGIAGMIADLQRQKRELEAARDAAKEAKKDS